VWGELQVWLSEDSRLGDPLLLMGSLPVLLSLAFTLEEKEKLSGCFLEKVLPGTFLPI
jgi:hypothetical protein